MATEDGTQPPLLVGISGLSSSGKTTLARLLRDTFPNVFILHQDDFYKPENELPKRGELVDWDSPAAIDFPAFLRALAHIKSSGSLPPELVSKEDLNAIGPSSVDQFQIDSYTAAVKHYTRRIAIIDGFLLLHSGEYGKEVRQTLDVKLFLRASYKNAKRRREARKGYVTLEEFWTDPPGYFDDIVWPGYVEQHSYLFKEPPKIENGQDGGSELYSNVNTEVLKELGIETPRDDDLRMATLFHWGLCMILLTQVF